jgi:CheY-like chemotaxis protein
MSQKLKTILLIDDDEATNYIHTMIIEDAHFAENIVVMDSAIEALKYLTTTVDGKYPQPDLIFLDINMPAMDGWTFMQKYSTLDLNQQAKTIIVMLSTSLNPSDKEKADTIPLISGFMSKPLSEEKLIGLRDTYFLKTLKS